MNSKIYKKKTPLLVFLIPAFAFLLVYLYYPFFPGGGGHERALV